MQRKHLLNDIKLYSYMVRMHIRAQTLHRGSFLISNITSVCIAGIVLLSLVVYLGPFSSLLGWKRGEVLLLFALTSISFGLAELMSGGIETFSETVRRGEFDKFLLRPAGTFIQVLGSDFRLRRQGSFIQGCCAFAFALFSLSSLKWTFAKLLVLVFGITSGAIIFLSVLLLGATLCFWTIDTPELTNTLLYGGRRMLGYPLSMYHEFFQRFFLFIVPLAFGSYIPACYLLNRPLPFALPEIVAFCTPLVALTVVFLVSLFWKFGISRYQSTGN